jgi:predicted DNA-binding transcriptional regulator YafY
LELIEKGDGRQVFVCVKCHATSTFADLSSLTEKKTKEIRLGAITLRDKSIERQKPNNSKSKEVNIELLNVIRAAMSGAKLLQFGYGNDKQIIQRTVEPYKLAQDGSKNIILYAYCTEGEGIRIFKLSKMVDAKLMEYGYKPKWEIEDKLKNGKGDR